MLFPFASLAAAKGELRLTPGAAVEKALSSNPHLLAAELEVKRAKVQLFWEGRLDNPELELAAASDALAKTDGESLFEVAFIQNFPLSSRLRDAVELRRVGVALAEAEVRERKRGLAREVRGACAELAAVAGKVALYEKLVALNAEIETFLQSAAERGEASPLDVTGTKLAGRVLQREAKAAAAEANSHGSKLRGLLGLGADQELEIAGGAALPDAAPAATMSRDAVLAKRPDYQAALIRGDVARAELALAKAESLEDLALKIFAERERSVDDPGGLGSNTLIGVGVTIPLPLRKKNEPAIESAQIGIDQAKLTAEGVALQIENELAGALTARMTAYAAAREAAGEILDLADQNLKDFRDAYVEGQAEFVQVQRAQEQKLELEKAALELAREYHLADAAVKHAAAADVPEKITSK